MLVKVKNKNQIRQKAKTDTQTKCFTAIQNLQNELTHLKTNVQSNIGISIRWNSELAAENDLYDVLKEYQTVVRPFIKE